MTPREQWYKDESNSIMLSKLLADPHMQTALGILLHEASPKDITGGSSADVLTNNALEHKKGVGYHKALSDLQALGEPPPQAPEGAPSQYSAEYVAEWAKRHGIPVPDPESEDQPTT